MVQILFVSERVQLGVLDVVDVPAAIEDPLGIPIGPALLPMGRVQAYPPSQKAPTVRSEINARGVLLRSVCEGGSRFGGFRRRLSRDHGRKPVELT